MSSKNKVQQGSGNVFRDMDAKYPERLLARAQIMHRIAEIIRSRKLKQEQAARLLGISQSKVSCLMNGKLSMFSLDHLFELLNALDRNVKIVIEFNSSKRKSATTQVILPLSA